jgi:hypothetical protein
MNEKRTKKQNKKVNFLLNFHKEDNIKIVEESRDVILAWEGTRVSWNKIEGLHYVKGTWFILVDRMGQNHNIPCPYVAD